MQIRLALISALPEIIAQSVKPIESIEGIKNLHVDGLGGGSGAGGSSGDPGGSIADQAVSAALRYRGQAPLIDALMKELGLRGSDLNGLTEAIRSDAAAGTTPPPVATPPSGKSG